MVVCTGWKVEIYFGYVEVSEEVSTLLHPFKDCRLIAVPFEDVRDTSARHSLLAGYVLPDRMGNGGVTYFRGCDG